MEKVSIKIDKATYLTALEVVEVYHEQLFEHIERCKVIQQTDNQLYGSEGSPLFFKLIQSEVSPRIYNALHNYFNKLAAMNGEQVFDANGITIDHFMSTFPNRKQLSGIRNLGQRSMFELLTFLSSNGYEIPQA